MVDVHVFFYFLRISALLEHIDLWIKHFISTVE